MTTLCLVVTSHPSLFSSFIIKTWITAFLLHLTIRLNCFRGEVWFSYRWLVTLPVLKTEYLGAKTFWATNRVTASGTVYSLELGYCRPWFHLLIYSKWCFTLMGNTNVVWDLPSYARVSAVKTVVLAHVWREVCVYVCDLQWFLSLFLYFHNTALLGWQKTEF